MEFNLADLIESIADAIPDQEAIICGDTRLTYRELDDRATRLAHYFLDNGVRAGDHIGVYLYNSTEYLEATFAAFKIRAVPININYRYVEHELEYLFDNADLVALVHHREFAPRIAAVAQRIPGIRLMVYVDDGSDADVASIGSKPYSEALESSSTTRDFASRSADDDYPFGYGKAEAIAAAAVALLLLAAAIGIAIESVREIVTPHHTPRPFTLVVLVAAVLVKEVMFRRVVRVGSDVGSTAVRADAFHHRSDAITSAAAFVGISIALIGGPGWESADDWAALVAAAIIVYNGIGVLRPAIHDLMDRAPGEEILARVGAAACAVSGVCAIEKLKVRKAGLGYYVDLHVQADPALPLRDAHILSGMVKSAIRGAVPEVEGALIHMEPYERR